MKSLVQSYKYNMSQQLNKNNVIHLPYFRRQDVFDSHNGTEVLYNHKYTLLNIARIDTTGVAIYKNHFLSEFTKQYEKIKEKGLNIQLQNEHVSRFFTYFVKLMALKFMIQPKKQLTGLINIFINDLFENAYANDRLVQESQEQANLQKSQANLQKSQANLQKSSINKEKVELQKQSQSVSAQNQLIFRKRREQLNNLKRCFKPTINIYFQKWYKGIGETYEKQVQNVKKLIQQQVLQPVKNDLRDKYQFIKKTQLLPDYKKQEVIKTIFSNYLKIIEMDSFQVHSKKEILSNFYTINNCFVKLKIPYCMETLRFQKQFKKQLNEIILPKYSDEKVPIIAKMIDYIPHIHNQNDKKEIPSILMEFIKNLAGFFISYKKKTRHVYPKTQVSDIFIDQKSLKLIVSYHPLLYDAVGLSGQTKSIELRLASEPTPIFDFNSCHIQYEEKFKWQIRKKYYYPSQSIYNEFDQEVQENANEAQNLLRQQERVHVWRLLNFIYFIANNEQLTKAKDQIYIEKLEKQQKQNNAKIEKLPRRFIFGNYKKMIKLIYDDIGAMPELLYQWLPPLKYSKELLQKLDNEQLNENSESQVSYEELRLPEEPTKRFQFTLSEIGKIFYIDQDEDSLLENLKLYSIKSQFRLRQILIKEINTLLANKKVFKKFMNVKKYLIMYLVAVLEKVYLMKSYQRLSKQQLNIKKEMQKQFEKEIKHLILRDELYKRESGIRSFLEKLLEYYNRRDLNYEFLKKNQQIYLNFDKIESLVKQATYLQEIEVAVINLPSVSDFEAALNTIKARKELELNQNELKILDQIAFSLRRKRYIEKTLEQTTKICQQPSNLESVLKKLFEKQFLLQNQEKKRILQPLLNKYSHQKLENFLRILSTNERRLQISNMLAKMPQQELRDYLLIELISQNHSSQALQKFTKEICVSIKKKKEVEELISQNVSSLKGRYRFQQALDRFRQLWSPRIESKLNKAHESLLADLTKIINNQIKKDIDKPQSYHKLSDFHKKVAEQTCLFYNYKFYTLVKMYATINETNWKNYERLYNNLFIGGKSITLRSSKEQIQTLPAEQIKLLISRMKLIHQVTFDKEMKKTMNQRGR